MLALTQWKEKLDTSSCLGKASLENDCFESSSHECRIFVRHPMCHVLIFILIERPVTTPPLLFITNTILQNPLLQ